MPLKCRLRVCRRNTLMARARLKAIEPVNWFLNFLFTLPFRKFTLLNGKEEEYPGDDKVEKAGPLTKLFPENEPLCSVHIKGECCHWLWTLNTDLMRFLISLWCSWDLHEHKVVAKVGRFILNLNTWERGECSLGWQCCSCVWALWTYILYRKGIWGHVQGFFWQPELQCSKNEWLNYRRLFWCIFFLCVQRLITSSVLCYLFEMNFLPFSKI